MISDQFVKLEEIEDHYYKGRIKLKEYKPLPWITSERHICNTYDFVVLSDSFHRNKSGHEKSSNEFSEFFIRKNFSYSKNARGLKEEKYTNKTIKFSCTVLRKYKKAFIAWAFNSNDYLSTIKTPFSICTVTWCQHNVHLDVDPSREVVYSDDNINGSPKLIESSCITNKLDFHPIFERYLKEKDLEIKSHKANRSYKIIQIKTAIPKSLQLLISVSLVNYYESINVKKIVLVQDVNGVIFITPYNHRFLHNMKYLLDNEGYRKHLNTISSFGIKIMNEKKSYYLEIKKNESVFSKVEEEITKMYTQSNYTYYSSNSDQIIKSRVIDSYKAENKLKPRQTVPYNKDYDRKPTNLPTDDNDFSNTPNDNYSSFSNQGESYELDSSIVGIEKLSSQLDGRLEPDVSLSTTDTPRGSSIQENNAISPMELQLPNNGEPFNQYTYFEINANNFIENNFQNTRLPLPSRTQYVGAFNRFLNIAFDERQLIYASSEILSYVYTPLGSDRDCFTTRGNMEIYVVSDQNYYELATRTFREIHPSVLLEKGQSSSAYYDAEEYSRENGLNYIYQVMPSNFRTSLDRLDRIFFEGSRPSALSSHDQYIRAYDIRAAIDLRNGITYYNSRFRVLEASVITQTQAFYSSSVESGYFEIARRRYDQAIDVYYRNRRTYVYEPMYAALDSALSFVISRDYSHNFMDYSNLYANALASGANAISLSHIQTLNTVLCIFHLSPGSFRELFESFSLSDDSIVIICLNILASSFSCISSQIISGILGYYQLESGSEFDFFADFLRSAYHLYTGFSSVRSLEFLAQLSRDRSRIDIVLRMTEIIFSRLLSQININTFFRYVLSFLPYFDYTTISNIEYTQMWEAYEVYLLQNRNADLIDRLRPITEQLMLQVTMGIMGLNDRTQMLEEIISSSTSTSGEFSFMSSLYQHFIARLGDSNDGEGPPRKRRKNR